MHIMENIVHDVRLQDRSYVSNKYRCFPIYLYGINMTRFLKIFWKKFRYSMNILDKFDLDRLLFKERAI